MKLTLGSFVLVPLAIFGAAPLFRPIAPDSTANGQSTAPILADSATRLFFLSDAANISHAATTQRWVQVYERNLVTSNLTLWSVNPSGRPAAGNSALAAVSSNAQVVAFISDAPDIVPDDVNGAPDLFLRDAVSGTTRLVSSAPDGTVAQALPAPSIGSVLMSQDGQWLFFESTATNLTAEADTNRVYELFAHHRGSGTNQLVVKSALDPFRTPAAGTRLLSITPDGRRVAFLSSSSSEIVAAAARGSRELFVRDMTTGDILWVSQAQSFFETNYQCLQAALSENGAFVAFTVTATNYPVMLFLVDLSTSSAVMVASNTAPDRIPLLSRDGQVVVYEDGTNVFRWSTFSGVTQLMNVTTNGTAPASGVARNAVMTPDGSHVCFCSNSPELTRNSTEDVFQIYCRDFSSGTTWLVTQTPDAIASAAPTAYSAMDLTPDGLTVAFDSTTGDLVPFDANRFADIFVRNRFAIAPSLVSYRSAAAPRQTALGHAFLQSSCLNSNGTRLVFGSWDTDGFPGDTNRLQNAFIADLQSGIVTPLLLSNRVRGFSISADGRYVAAYVEDGRNGEQTTRLSRFDLETGAERVIKQSTWSDPVRFGPAISSDGNLVISARNFAFLLYNVTSDTNEYPVSAIMIDYQTAEALISPDSRYVVGRTPQSEYYLWVFDRLTQTINTLEKPYVNDVAISGNSRYLAFVNLTNGFVLRRDLVEKQSEVVTENLRSISMSADGRYIVGEGIGYGERRPAPIVLLDCVTKEKTTISVGAGGVVGKGILPVISANARYVAYLTDSSEIVPGNVRSRNQVVLWDRMLATTTLLSVSTSGAPGNDRSGRPYISASGQVIAFQSMASDLTPGDYNDAQDLFIVKIDDDDSDGDGMDDNWEVAYFGDLSRDGNGDMDGDGSSDRHEFLAGTDPTNIGSVFRVLTLSRLGTTGRTVIWSGNPSGSYRVEYKDDLSSEWTTLPATITWSGGTGRADDPTPAARRFYRVVRAP